MNDTDGFTECERLDACPVCGGRDFAPRFLPDVMRCNKCGVLFRSPRPTQGEIARSYNQAATFTEWQSNEEGRRAMWQRRLVLVRRSCSAGRLLDVGTGDAHFLDQAANYFQVQGTDFSESAAVFARRRGHSITVGQIEDIDFGGLAFDCITMWHILEHLPRPGDAVRRVCAMLKPGGHLFIAVPNEENRLARHRIGLLRAENPLGNLQFGSEIHLTHFQPETLRRFIQSNGLELVSFGVDDIYMRHTARNRAVLAMQKMLARLTGWHFSMAMFVVARKPDGA
jgi:2-polyprenyl-3-methyl-5-hydroxy-6-metoxy-1,4-benzoquinol methylase